MYTSHHQLDFVAAGLIILVMSLIAWGTHQTTLLNSAMKITNLVIIVLVLAFTFPHAHRSNWDNFFPFGPSCGSCLLTTCMRAEPTVKLICRRTWRLQRGNANLLRVRRLQCGFQPGRGGVAVCSLCSWLPSSIVCMPVLSCPAVRRPSTPGRTYPLP